MKERYCPARDDRGRQCRLAEDHAERGHEKHVANDGAEFAESVKRDFALTLLEPLPAVMAGHVTYACRGETWLQALEDFDRRHPGRLTDAAFTLTRLAR